MTFKEIKQKFTTKLICIGCDKIEEVKGAFSPEIICDDCRKIIEKIAKKRYSHLRFIADIETGIYQTDIITKTEFKKEFAEFLKTKGYKI